MKIFFALFFLLAIILAAYPFLDSSKNLETLTGLPWQIKVQNDGSTQVFGLHIGVSHLSHVIEKLGSDMELAVIASADEVGSLEMYYGHYRAGLLSGKLVIQTKISEKKIKRWRNNALKYEYTATGLAKKYTLSANDLLQVLDETVTGLTFIPTVKLDEKIILARFGEPKQRIQLTGVMHYLYPKKGLDIALHDKSKSVLQYVNPANFSQLITPLQ